MAELVSLKRRMHLIKASQFFSGLAFVFNLLFVLATYLSVTTITPLLFPVAIILMAVSMSLFIVEIYLSTGALKIHIGDVETLREKTGN
jgi:glucan phosphoethanolaminetransferase (alkaline phosphatase superfamily)